MRREVTFSFLRRCLLGFLAAAVITSSSAETGVAEKRNEYRNVDYAYAVSLPGELHYEMNKAPNPNHGFRITVAPSASVWVDSSYTDDPTLSQAVDSERAIWEESCTSTSTEAKELGSATAVQITFKCVQPEAGSPTTVTLLMALASPPNRGRIRYEIGMQYLSGATSRVRTQQVFNAVQAGFHFLHS
jgi:hypothetical protein